MNKIFYCIFIPIFIGCVPTLGQIRRECQLKFDVDSSGFNNCVNEGIYESNRKMYIYRSIGTAFSHMGGATNNSDVSCTRYDRNVSCSDGTTCYISGDNNNYYMNCSNGKNCSYISGIINCN